MYGTMLSYHIISCHHPCCMCTDFDLLLTLRANIPSPESSYPSITWKMHFLRSWCLQNLTLDCEVFVTNLKIARLRVLPMFSVIVYFITWYNKSMDHFCYMRHICAVLYCHRVPLHTLNIWNIWWIIYMKVSRVVQVSIMRMNTTSRG